MSIADARTGVSCLIPAAGAGLRLGQGTKGFLSLSGRPLLCWVADKALQVADEVIVAVPADRLEDATHLLPGCRVVVGGGSRHESVAMLAEHARGDWLLLHDVARPFVSVELLRSVVAAARATGCAGTRTATVPRPAVTSSGTCDRLGSAIVSGPGQKRSASSCASGGQSVTSARAPAMSATCAMSGL